jgi:cell wall-associated NlpC family hydrolase
MVAASTSGLLASHASADQVTDLKAKAAALASRINALGLQEEALSEQYDAAQMRAAAIQAQVASAAQQVATAEANANKAKEALKQDAVLAYVHGGNSPFSSGGGALSSANESLLRAEYVNSLAANQSDAIDQFRLAALQEQAAKAQLQQQQSAAQAQLALVNQDRQAAASLASQLQATQSQVNGQIATLIAQQEAAARAAAAQEAAARLAAAQAAARARVVSAPNATLTASNPPPVGHGAAGAVAAAESRVGDWYQWGAAGPNTFDCSGLVMWAYAQVGVSLPHYSGGQYADTTHIPMSDLQPGDLVFPSDPGEHVAMYVGNGEIVEAPYTGAQVHIVPMGSWFVLASRVEG